MLSWVWTTVVVAAGAIGCAGQKEPTSADFAALSAPKEPATVDLHSLPKSDPMLVRLRSVPLCLYLLDKKSGHALRMSLDGSIRELVLAVKASKTPSPGFTVTGNQMAAGSQKLFLPWGPGIPEPCYVDSADVESLDLWQKHERPKGCVSVGNWKRFEVAQIPYDVGSADSPWYVRYEYKLRKLEPNHYHEDHVSTRFFLKGKSVEVYMGASPSVLALINPGYAVVDHRGDIVLWDLTRDRRVRLCRSWQTVVWPRDLRRSERYAPRTGRGIRIDAWGKPRTADAGRVPPTH